jgi:hypothetical protein
MNSYVFITLAAFFLLPPTVVSAQFYVEKNAMITGQSCLHFEETEEEAHSYEDNNIAGAKIYLFGSVTIANLAQLTNAEIIYLPTTSVKTSNLASTSSVSCPKDLPKNQNPPKEERRRKAAAPHTTFAANDGSTLLQANEKWLCIVPTTQNAQKILAKNAKQNTEFHLENQLSSKLYTQAQNGNKTADYEYYYFSRPPPQIA